MNLTETMVKIWCSFNSISNLLVCQFIIKLVFNFSVFLSENVAIIYFFWKGEIERNKEKEIHFHSMLFYVVVCILYWFVPIINCIFLSYYNTKSQRCWQPNSYIIFISTMWCGKFYLPKRIFQNISNDKNTTI